LTYVGGVFGGNMKIASHLCYFSYLSHINVCANVKCKGEVT
jgi:hypothetical protein